MPRVRRLRRVYTWLWAAWIGLFALIETAALLDRRKGDTLSEHVWWARGRWRLATRLAVGALLGWLAYHLLWQ